MPSIPLQSRRKRNPPIANLNLIDDDVWERTFRLLGLEPLHPAGRTIAASTMADAPMIEVGGPRAGMKGFADLPLEVKGEIMKYVSSQDLVALSLVSRSFRDLAAAQLYRNFHIVFPDEDDPSYESPIDGLASGLDTFVSSQYNYAKYLKEIMLDTLSGGEKGERAYRHYTYDVSCGKFMNTLFLLTLRKAHGLEVFRWDLRVELSRPIYKVLHNMQLLQHFHVRMHPGRTIYEDPPPLPQLGLEIQQPGHASISPQTATLPMPPAFPMNSFSTAKQASKSKSKREMRSDDFGLVRMTSVEPPTLSGFHNLKSLAVLDMDNLDYITELQGCIKNSAATLTKLKLSFSERLAQASRKPLTSMQQENVDPDQSDDEVVDEFGNTIHLPPPQLSSSGDEGITGPMRVLRAKEEKIAQEAVLGRIFGIEPDPLASLEEEKAEKNEEKAAKEDPDAKARWVKEFLLLNQKYNKANDSHGSNAGLMADALEMIEKAMKIQSDSQKEVETSKEEEKRQEDKEKENATKKSDDAVTSSESPSTEAQLPIQEEFRDTAKTAVEPVVADDTQVEKSEEKESLFAESKPQLIKADKNRPQPEDIDVNAPDSEEDIRDFEEVAEGDEQTEQPEAAKTPVAEIVPEEAQSAEEQVSIKAGKTKSQLLTPYLQGRMDEWRALSKEYNALKIGVSNANAEVQQTATELKDWSSGATSVDSDMVQLMALRVERIQNYIDATLQSMNEIAASMRSCRAALAAPAGVKNEHSVAEYIHKSRGLQIKSLSLYLIPLKSSVLSRVLDLRVLQRITLLNVGSQDKFWVALQALNSEAPLKLTKIFTDNVTPVFLNFVNELEPTLEDLFLLEGREKSDLREVRRSSRDRNRATTSTPRTTVTTEMIRKLALKKHIATLKRLVINYFDGSHWDATELVIKLICRKGKKLEELAMSMGSRSTHTFNQYLPSLTSLRAFHILFFRNDDHCPWVAREVRKFAVDCVAAHPGMKLEYIAVGNTVERIVRRAKKLPKKKKSTKGKGKEPATGMNDSINRPALNPLGLITLEQLMQAGGGRNQDSSSEESEWSGDDDWRGDRGPGMRLETLEGMKFYDIFGVRMWNKDVLGGWL